VVKKWASNKEGKNMRDINKMFYVKEALKRILGNIDVGHRARKGYFLKEINKFDLSNKLILDAGCGDGEYMFEIIRRYPVRELVGVEIQKEKVDFINKRLNKLNYNNVCTICKDLSRGRLPSSKFDFCFCIDVLEHIKNDKKVIANVFNSLRYGGLFLIHVPNSKAKRFFKEFRNYRQADHVRNGYDLEGLINLLEGLGFKILSTKYTTGQLVALNWEIEKKIEKIFPRRLSQTLCYPLTVLSVFIDIRKQLADGNGILVIAQKINLQQDCINHSLIDLVIFPLHDWKKCEKEGFRTRDTHLIQHFEKNKNVRRMLVVDRPMTLSEMILKKGYWKIKSGKIIKKTPFTSLTKVSKKIYVLDIFSWDLIKPLILKRDWWGYIFRKDRVIQKIKKDISFLNLNNKVLFLWSPLSTGVIGKLGEQMVVFDTLDNLTRHSEIEDARGYIKNGYRIIKEKADIIFANSKETQRFMKNPRISPIFIPNGVDKMFFQLKREKTPEDLKNIPKPIIGYAGKIAKRINVDLLSFLALKLPQVNFVLIGQFLNKKWVKSLFKFRNIHFLGDKHYSQLPYYLGNFDVCIIPHNIRSLESGEDPIKLYEYLAAGKPVVAINIARVDHFEDTITITHTKEEFLEGIIYWCKRVKEDKSLSKKLKDSISEIHLWGRKAEMMINLILERMSEGKRIN